MSKTNITIKSNTQTLPTANNVINEITSAWNKATEYMMFVASTLHQYQSNKDSVEAKQLWKEIKDTLIEKKIMSKTTISNLCKIGENQLLKQNIKKLPPAYNTLWELSRLPDSELRSKFKSGLITPQLKLEDVREWKTVQSSDDNVEVVEVEVHQSEFQKSIVISFKKSDIVNKHDVINQNIKKIKSMMRYANIELNGLLRTKIENNS
jgi:hypothetical protein